jgi:hypothetical protein
MRSTIEVKTEQFASLEYLPQLQTLRSVLWVRQQYVAELVSHTIPIPFQVQKVKMPLQGVDGLVEVIPSTTLH